MEIFFTRHYLGLGQMVARALMHWLVVVIRVEASKVMVMHFICVERLGQGAASH